MDPLWVIQLQQDFLRFPKAFCGVRALHVPLISWSSRARLVKILGVGELGDGPVVIAT